MLTVKTKRQKHKIEKGGAIFYVSPVTPSDMRELLKAHEIVKWEAPTKRAQPQRFVEPDYLGITFDRIDRSIVDWEGVVDEEGNELPCDREHKLLVFEYNPALINDVMEEADRLAEAELAREKEEAKN